MYAAVQAGAWTRKLKLLCGLVSQLCLGVSALLWVGARWSGRCRTLVLLHTGRESGINVLQVFDLRRKLSDHVHKSIFIHMAKVHAGNLCICPVHHSHDLPVARNLVFLPACWLSMSSRPWPMHISTWRHSEMAEVHIGKCYPCLGAPQLPWTDCSLPLVLSLSSFNHGGNDRRPIPKLRSSTPSDTPSGLRNDRQFSADFRQRYQRVSLDSRVLEITLFAWEWDGRKLRWWAPVYCHLQPKLVLVPPDLLLFQIQANPTSQRPFMPLFYPSSCLVLLI